MKLKTVLRLTLPLALCLSAQVHATVEQQILQRCQQNLRGYGVSQVTRCYHSDIAAVRELNRYGKQHHAVIKSCLRDFKSSGYVAVKDCTEQRIAAGPTLPDILNTVAPWFLGFR